MGVAFISYAFSVVTELTSVFLFVFVVQNVGHAAKYLVRCLCWDW